MNDVVEMCKCGHCCKSHEEECVYANCECHEFHFDGVIMTGIEE